MSSTGKLTLVFALLIELLPNFSYHLGVFNDKYWWWNEEEEPNHELSFNWSIFGCCLMVWGIVYYISNQDIDWVSIVFCRYFGREEINFKKYSF